MMGRYPEALEMFEKGRALGGDVPNILAAMGHLHALSGNADRARELLAQLEGQAQAKYIPSTCFAIIHLGLGEKDRALEWLEKGCKQREVPLVSLNVHPLYDPLRGHPRFEKILKQLGFR
jgi:serine/threonine-protein kinase